MKLGARREKAARAWAGFPQRQVHFGRSGRRGFDSKSVDRLISFQDLASSRRARRVSAEARIPSIGYCPRRIELLRGYSLDRVCQYASGLRQKVLAAATGPHWEQ